MRSTTRIRGVAGNFKKFEERPQAADRAARRPPCRTSPSASTPSSRRSASATLMKSWGIRRQVGKRRSSSSTEIAEPRRRAGHSSAQRRSQGRTRRRTPGLINKLIEHVVEQPALQRHLQDHRGVPRPVLQAGQAHPGRRRSGDSVLRRLGQQPHLRRRHRLAVLRARRPTRQPARPQLRLRRHLVRQEDPRKFAGASRPQGVPLPAGPTPLTTNLLHDLGRRWPASGPKSDAAPVLHGKPPAPRPPVREPETTHAF